MPPPTGSTGCWRAPSATCRAAACRRSSATGGSRSPARWSASPRPEGAAGRRDRRSRSRPRRRPSRGASRSRSPSSTRTTSSSSSTSRPGLVVHPAAGHDSGTLVNALIAHCGESLSGIGGVRRPGIVHRLDKDTSGLLVVAKTDRAHRGLSAQFADHGRTGPLERAYHGAGLGRARPGRAASIEAPIGRSVREPREDGGRRRRSRPPRAARTTPSRRCSAPPRRRWRASCAAGWRPAARTRSASTWPRSAIRCSATRATGSGFTHQGGPALARGARGASRPRPPGPARRRARLRAPGERRKPAFRERTAARHGSG